MVNVAIFRDQEVQSSHLEAWTAQALRHAPPDIRLRIYTSAAMPVERPDCFGLPRVWGLGPLFAYEARAGQIPA